MLVALIVRSAVAGRHAVAVDRERRAATLARLTALREAGHLSTEHVRLAARGLDVTERTIWRWLDEPAQDAPRRPGRAP
ncbi:hypothetical protein ACIBHX_43420 [Nonomuraea sp. NPDC050536]|uniref:hypothetical protein n=1 Tax=Nonomuraea sp. NPDC050536 TaxID=3364366 RepID=UPI0037C91493